MKNIKITDLTLRDAKLTNEFSLSFKEKLALARELDRLNVDVIEMPLIENIKQDSLLIKTLASLLQNSTLSCCVGSTEDSLENAWNAVSGASKPRLHIMLPVSIVQMEYFSHLKPTQMLDLIKKLCKAASEKCNEVEFSAVDATRAEYAFLCTAIETAIESGAKIITICDTAGTMLPSEFSDFITRLHNDIPKLKNAELSIQCSSELGLASACSFAAVTAGATQIKTVVCGKEYPNIEEIVHIFAARGESLDISSSVDRTAIYRSLQKLTWLNSSNKSAPTPFDSTIGKTDFDEDIKLDANTDIGELNRVLTTHGYSLSENDLADVYREFARIASKKSINLKELDVIVANSAMQVPPTYILDEYVINNINIQDTVQATASIQISKNGEKLRGLSAGDGPIDAAFLAIEQILGHHYELDDFQIYAVTEGRSAMGKAIVKLRVGSNIYSGQGLSTDIVGASIRAYIDALNKIVYEENII